MRFLRRLCFSAIAVAAVACKHTAPFSVATYDSTNPFQPGNPARLTLDSGPDTRPSWLPDGSAFLYTADLGSPDPHDQCLAVMPRSGGSITRTICATTDPAGDSINVFLAPAVANDGRMAFVRTSTRANLGLLVPDHVSLALATYGAPEPAAQILSLPYFSPDSQPVNFASDLHWASPSTLVFLADRFVTNCLDSSCHTSDTTITGLEIDLFTFAGVGTPPTLTAVAGTFGATALATSGSDTLYYAIASTSGNLHRRILSTAADTVVFTFPGAIQGLSAAAGRVVAAVSGTLHLLTPATGGDVVLTLPPGVPDHPALDPTGHLLVAEVRVSASESPDLWMWSLP